MTIKHATLVVLLALPLGCDKETSTTPPASASATPPPAAPAAKPIPDGFFAVTPQIVVADVDAAVDFYGKAFGAQKLFSMPDEQGKGLHAEVKIGDSIIMIDAENPGEGMKSPKTLAGSPATLMIYVPNADETVATATAAGATVKTPLEDQFWGDRYGEVEDPFGHRWAVATHKEDLTAEQMQQRAALLPPPPDPKKKKKKAKKPAEPEWKQVAGTPAKTPVPAEYHTVTLALTTPNAAAAIEFYKTAFGAVETARMPDPNGKIMHAELKIGDSIVMLSDEFPEMGGKSATTLGGSPVALHFYTEDVDGTFAKAKGAGGKELMAVSDVFWGDRYGAVIDVAGFMWGVATHKEDLTPQQITERLKQQTGAGGPAKAEGGATPPAAAPASATAPAAGATPPATAPATPPK
jgi:uncharacterized glyoxalase superfamily protein PhnB